MQTIATFANIIPANLAKAQLADAGIPVYLANEQIVNIAWHLTNAFGGIELQVADENVEEARAILADHADIPATRLHSVDEDDYSTEELADEEAQTTLTPRERNADRALRTALLSLLLFPLVLYSVWLLIEIALSAEPLRPIHRRHAILATLVSLPLFALMSFWFRVEFWR